MKLPLLAIPALACIVALAYSAMPGQAPESPRNPATTPTPRTDAAILARQAEVLRRAREAPASPVVFLGDSITQGFEGAGQAAWDRHLAPLGALNLGVSGDRTEHVLWRLEQASLARLEPKAIVLLIGTNNLGHGTSTAEQTLEGLHRILATLRAQAPDAVVVALEIFPRGERFNAMRGDIAQINQVLRTQRGERVRVLSIGDRWVRRDGGIARESMPDFLHLSEAAYEEWAAELAPVLRGIVGR
jgi:lysophospholipase L1-like esterase